MLAQQYKNLLLPHVGTFNMFREKIDNAMNLGLGETSYVVSITHGTWMYHARDPCWAQDRQSTTFASWKGHSSSIQI